MNKLLIIAAMTVAQPAEVRMNDGSIITVTLSRPSVQVATKYGDLHVPVGDIRRIDFGWHQKDKSHVDRLIASLASAVFKDRDEATKSLREAGASVYAVLKAYKSQDQEQMKRLEQIVKHIEDNSAQADVERPTYDRISASEFPIIGVVQGDFEATSAVFGKVKFALSDIRSIAMKHPLVALTVPAPGIDAEWIDSMAVVDGNFIITAVGVVDLWPATPGAHTATPKGVSQAGRNSTYLAGALLGKVGNGPTFVVGERYDGSGDGRLWLQIVPSSWNNASAGSYTVKIKR